jgi:hypothetical protein
VTSLRRSFFVCGALALAGLVSIGIAWRPLADSLVVAIQLPYLVSGVMGGLAVLGFALGLIAIQATRRQEAIERMEFNRLVVASADLLAELQTDRRR